jgi:1-phosphofructokinase family hexose kinase
MNKNSSIITVGLCPSWDTVLCFDGIEWGQHKVASSAESRPAGKALNISHALAWMGEKNTAAGLWGRDDFEQMQKAMQPLKQLVKVKMTAADGETRRNVTVVDTANEREMHLRNKSELASRKTLGKLEGDLLEMVDRNSVCVFAGMMPGGEFLGDAVRIMESCRKRGAGIVADTYGEPLRRVIETGAVWMIKPNVEELQELIGQGVTDSAAGLVRAGRELLGRVEVVVVSRGEKGAVVVTRDGAWRGRCVGRAKVISTVGCGDFLLAGFLKGMKERSDVGAALQTGIQVATARSRGWVDGRSWGQARREIEVEVQRV